MKVTVADMRLLRRAESRIDSTHGPMVRPCAVSGRKIIYPRLPRKAECPDFPGRRENKSFAAPQSTQDAIPHGRRRKGDFRALRFSTYRRPPLLLVGDRFRAGRPPSPPPPPPPQIEGVGGHPPRNGAVARIAQGRIAKHLDPR